MAGQGRWWVWIYNPQEGSHIEYERADSAEEAVEAFLQRRKSAPGEHVYVVEHVGVDVFGLGVVARSTERP